jgi:hypothetical protein
MKTFAALLLVAAVVSATEYDALSTFQAADWSTESTEAPGFTQEATDAPTMTLMDAVEELKLKAPAALKEHVVRVAKHASLIQSTNLDARAKAYKHSFNKSKAALHSALNMLVSQLKAGHKHDTGVLKQTKRSLEKGMSSVLAAAQNKAKSAKHKACPLQRAEEKARSKRSGAKKAMLKTGNAKVCPLSTTMEDMDVDKNTPAFGVELRNKWDRVRAKYVKHNAAHNAAVKAHEAAKSKVAAAYAAMKTAVKLEASNSHSRCKQAKAEYEVLKKDVFSNVKTRKSVATSVLVVKCYVNHITNNNAAHHCANRARRQSQAIWNIRAPAWKPCASPASLQSSFGPVNWHASYRNCAGHRAHVKRQAHLKRVNEKKYKKEAKIRKEKNSKELKKKEKAQKKAAKKERAAKTKAEKAGKAKKRAAEKKAKKIAAERTKKEKSLKEKASKERKKKVAKQKERDSKEKAAKKREEKALKSRNEKNRKAAKKALKERNAKERNAKEANKKEGANKEKNKKEKSKKEKKAKEGVAKRKAEAAAKAHKEKAAKKAAAVAKEKSAKVAAEKKKKAEEKAHKKRQAERDGKAKKKEKANKEKSAKAAKKEKAAKKKAAEKAKKAKAAKAKEQKDKASKAAAAKKEASAKAAKAAAKKEKSAKAAAHEKNTKLAKERKGKNTCVLKAYEHNNYRGKVLSTHHVCSSEHSFHLPKTGRRRGYEASSFKLSSGCRQVQLWDEDACRKNYRDNVNIQSSVSSVKYDLNDDICGVTVWANRNGWCRL